MVDCQEERHNSLLITCWGLADSLDTIRLYEGSWSCHKLNGIKDN